VPWKIFNEREHKLWTTEHLELADATGITTWAVSGLVDSVSTALPIHKTTARL
jgi:hypothetical protein